MSYPAARTFWIDPSGETARGARRYAGCPGTERCANDRYHDAITWVDRVKTETKMDLDNTRVRRDVPPLDPDGDYWPSMCDNCQYVFTPYDAKQTFSEEIFRRPDTGEEFTLPTYAGSAPPGAPKVGPGGMWHAYWLPSHWRADDGIALAVCLPNRHVWLVDSQANNCTRPGEPHKCWIRHGDPRTEQVTVDKNGDTCSAGAGSILSGDYHGFFQAGLLTAG